MNDTTTTKMTLTTTMRRSEVTDKVVVISCADNVIDDENGDDGVDNFDEDHFAGQRVTVAELSIPSSTTHRRRRRRRGQRRSTILQRPPEGVNQHSSKLIDIFDGSFLFLSTILIPTILFLNAMRAQAQPYREGKQGQQQGHRVAVIGGGITGTFFAKYLADLESTTGSCSLMSLTLFDQSNDDELSSVRGGYINNNNNKDHSRQKTPDGSSYQTATYLLRDFDGLEQHQQSLTVEVGSVTSDIALSKYHSPLLLDMAQKGNLTIQHSMKTRIEQVLLDSIGSVLLRYTVDKKLVSSSDPSSEEEAASSFFTSLKSWLYFPPIVRRYFIDWYVISRLVSKVNTKKLRASELLLSEKYIPSSPMELWSRADLNAGGGLSLDELCDSLMIPDDKTATKERGSISWRVWLISAITGGAMSQGSIRSEVLSVATLLLFGQELSNVGALTGLWATSAFMLDFLFAGTNSINERQRQYRVAGGSTKLIQSAWEQASETYRNSKCRRTDRSESGTSPADDDDEGILFVSASVSTVVGSPVNGFVLYDDGGKSIGRFDTVILAIPMPLANVEFLIESHMDETAVLQPMPLGGLIENEDNESSGGRNHPDSSTVAHDHDGHAPLPRQLPSVVTRPYIPQISTLVRSGVLQEDLVFGSNITTKESLTSVSEESSSSNDVRRQVFLTSSSYHTIVAILQITTPSDIAPNNTRMERGESEASGTSSSPCCYYKVISTERISTDVVHELFGPSAEIEFEHVGAVPNLDPSSTSVASFGGEVVDTPFLMYDGAVGFHGHTKSGALYYPNLFELFMPFPEGNAMAALTVANLLAGRLEWTPKEGDGFDAGDEL